MAGAPDLTTYLLTQGVLGVACIALSIACIKLYNKLQEVQDARLQDSKDVTKEVTTVIQSNTQSNLVLAAKIEAGKKEGAA